MKIRELQEFSKFMENDIAGVLLINPFWVEYLLNLFFQDYLGEVWEEICDTQLKFNKLMEGNAYGIIGQELGDKLK